MQSTIYPPPDKNPDSFAESNPYLTVDTSLFPAAFQTALLAALSNDHDLDEATDGLLIHSDNFQALNLLQARYRGQVKCIYIDPPYNTGGDGFIYKDNYQHSSWLSLLEGRIELSKFLMSIDSAIFISIDEKEHHNLKLITSNIFGNSNLLADFIWISEGNFDNQAKIKVAHEYILSYALNEKDFPPPPVIDPSIDKNSKLFRNEIRNTIVKNGPKNPISSISLPVYFPSSLKQGIIKKEQIAYPRYSDDLIIENYKLVNPVVAESGWSSKALCEQFIENNMQTVLDSKNQETIFFISNTGAIEAVKKRPENQSYVTSTIKGVGTIQSTKSFLDHMNCSYPHYPKPIKLVSYLSSMTGSEGITLDYFAGSGTTAHAVINLNREDGGRRKYILVEQGEYFDTVLKPRVQKVVYAENWKDGKPVPSEKTSENNKNPFGSVPQIVKVLKLESYEDTLNNLVLKKQGELYEALPENVREDYLLRYMFNEQSREALLNTDIFKRPFNYQMDISTNSAGATERMNIDLVETFNYLLGLRVSGIGGDVEKHGYLTVEGTLPNGGKTLVIWRDYEKVGYEGLDALLGRLKINPQDSEYGTVYINGDHNIATVWENENGVSGRLKIRQIESEFMALMFGEAQ